MKKVLIIVGTRPNIIKVTQFKRIAESYDNIEVKIAHTGQHYDTNMSDVFFDQFGFQPDYFLNIGSATPNTQIANIMIGLEKLITEDFHPDILIVPGDVNSTLAACITANKMGIKLAHLESGLRSLDRDMPEEINRVLSDEITDHFFVTEQSGVDNLAAENKVGEVHFVGNTMIDTLFHFDKEIEADGILDEYALDKGKFVLMTIHRPSNVDSEEGIKKLLELIKSLSSRYKIVFPIHPRTTNKIKEYGLQWEFDEVKNLITSGPLGYFQFQKLIKYAAFILTDSGGIQEESTYRQVPCLTLRENTERPSTVTMGTNTLVAFEIDALTTHIEEIENGTYKQGTIPSLWDGGTTARIFEILDKIL